MVHDAHLPNGSQPGRYFARRPSSVAPAFGESDWKTAVDPDGIRRDRTMERAQHLDDLRHELEFVNTLTPGRILDIGCGLGFFLSGVDDAWEKLGIEMSEFAVSQAGQWGRVEMGPVENADYPPASFDVVVMHHVIEHIEDPERTINEVRRILRPGGRLVLGAPDFDGACARRYGSGYRLLHDPTHISLFSNESMHRFLRDHGFLIEHVDYPFFDTRHFTEENLLRMLDVEGISPPFYGSFMTFYCRKPKGGVLTALLQRLGSYAPHELPAVDRAAATVVRLVTEAVERGGRVLIDAGPRTPWLEESARDLWRKLAGDSAPNCPVAAAGAGLGACESPSVSEDVTLCFRLDEEARTSITDPRESGAKIVIRRESGQAGGSGQASTLDVPLQYGLTAAATEAAILGALLEEIWSRRAEQREDMRGIGSTSGGGTS